MDVPYHKILTGRSQDGTYSGNRILLVHDLPSVVLSMSTDPIPCFPRISLSAKWHIASSMSSNMGSSRQYHLRFSCILLIRVLFLFAWEARFDGHIRHLAHASPRHHHRLQERMTLALGLDDSLYNLIGVTRQARSRLVE